MCFQHVKQIRPWSLISTWCTARTSESIVEENVLTAMSSLTGRGGQARRHAALLNSSLPGPPGAPALIPVRAGASLGAAEYWKEKSLGEQGERMAANSRWK
eukprot:756104-Hanusia_phi.AAC.3